jgi:hypothetical protein
VATTTTVSATFSAAVTAATLTVQAASGACTGSFQVSTDDFATCLGLGTVVTTATSITATPTPALAASTRYRIRVTAAVTDTFSNPVTAYTTPVGFLTTAATSSACGVVISQVYGGGGNSGAQWKNDFIELKNLGNTAVSLTGWSVQYVSAAGTGTWAVTNLSGTLQPGAYYLVQEAAGAGGQPALPTPDAIGTIAMSANAGKVALVNNTTALTGSGCPIGPSVVDLVGFGSTANCSEGSVPTATLANNTAALRAGFSCADTNNNGADFAIGAPTPRNSSTSSRSCSVCGVQNETNAANEADWCAVQFPQGFTVAVSTVTPVLYGRVYEAGVTEPAGPAAAVLAQVGYALVGVDPRTQCGWQFFPASFNVQVGNDDEYQGTFTSPAYAGTFWYTFRFSVDNGATWTFADDDGAGSNAGLTFDLGQLPVMTVP